MIIDANKIINRRYITSVICMLTDEKQELPYPIYTCNNHTCDNKIDFYGSKEVNLLRL